MSEYDRKTDPQGFYNIFTVQPWWDFGPELLTLLLLTPLWE